MSHRLLFTARAEALAVSPASVGAALDRPRADAVIRDVVRAHGVAGCSAAMAYEYGENQDSAARRMRWAIETVSALYGRP